MSNEIVRITERRHIVSILAIEDERLDAQVLHLRNISKVEWVQWLESMISKENLIGMWGILENDKIRYYIVAMNAVMPPISKAIMLLYQNFFGAKDSNGNNYGRVLDYIKKWGIELGANEICAFTRYPRIMSRFGFKKENHTSVTIPIGI